MQAPIITSYEVDYGFTPEVGVFDLNFTVSAGTIFGLIGPSGCGKTTTVRLLTGLYKPERGHIRVMGEKPFTFSRRARERIGYMPQQFVLYPNLSVRDNLMFVASLYGMGLWRRRKRLKEMLSLVELAPARRRLSRQLSGGMQRRLELACALIHDPHIVFADEPTAGIDPVLRGKFWEYFRHLRDEGRTIFVTTQYINEAVHCDVVGVMRDGRLLYLDTPDGLRRQALGGEVIRILVEADDQGDALHLLTRLSIIKQIHTSHDEPGRLHVHVENASEAIPMLFHVLNGHEDIKILQMEAYQPPFDDIFIDLVKQAEPEQKPL
jgi:ABC-2 type transport system ATP-binding protein